jgi:hypothetical protein
MSRRRFTGKVRMEHRVPKLEKNVERRKMIARMKPHSRKGVLLKHKVRKR